MCHHPYPQCLQQYPYVKIYKFVKIDYYKLRKKNTPQYNIHFDGTGGIVTFDGMPCHCHFYTNGDPISALDHYKNF